MLQRVRCMRCKKWVTIWPPLLTLLLPMVTGAAEPPCGASEFRQFDFWKGHWEVRLADDRMAGSNSIERTQQGCLLVENWTGAQGGTGTSLNFYSPIAGLWRQVWVSPGAIIDISGGLRGADMVLEGSITYSGAEQATYPFRGTWSPLPDGRVRQFFEEARQPEVWQTWFEGFYTRADD